MSKHRWSPAISLLLISCLVLGGVFLARYTRSDRDIFIAVPYFKPINAVTSLEWKPEKVTLPKAGDSGSEHPGYRLASVHCTRCHLLPSPGQLPRETWPFVLTWMSNYLGYTNTYVPFSNNVEASLIPESRLVSDSEFREISEYYLIHARSQEALVANKSRTRAITDQFVSTSPNDRLPNGELVSLVFFDNSRGHLFIGLGQQNRLEIFDRQGKLVLRKETTSAPIDIDLLLNGFRLTTMGDFMEDKKRGAVADYSYQGAGKSKPTAVVEGYHRLTESHTVDLDLDHRNDLLLVGFGAGSKGQVSIRWSEDVDTAETILLEHSGALNAKIHDFDRNGLDDIVLITSQSQQELLLYLNQGNRSFEKRILRKEVAGFGFNHLTLGDFNEDGLVDLVLVNGNNMEIKDAPLKPYHGIRVLRNRGGLKFEEQFFYPMFGALKAVVHDFDRDGDDDIAAIAFYPDWSNKNPETFVYLENEAGESFSASGLAHEASGRWISMNLGDVDEDGWDDIILGGGYILQGVGSQFRDHVRSWSRTRPSVVVLKNQGSRDVRP